MITFTKMLLSGQSDLNDAGVLGPGALGRIRELALYVRFGPGTSAGAVKIEAASDEKFAGAWATLQAVFFGVNPLLDSVGSTSLEQSTSDVGELTANEQIIILLQQTATTAQLRSAGLTGTLR